MEIILIFIIFLVIMYNINAKPNSVAMREILIYKCGLKNIQCKKNSKKEIYYTGMKQGEEFMVSDKYIKKVINETVIHEIKRQMDMEHYHNCILIVNTVNNIMDNVKNLAEENGIEIVGIYSSSSNHLNTHKNTNNSEEPLKDRYEKKYVTQENSEPIQSGGKANSLLGNIFNNKIEKL